MTIKRTVVATALAAGLVGGVLAMAGPAAAVSVAPSGYHENGQHENGQHDNGVGTAVDPSGHPWHGIVGGDSVTPAGHNWLDGPGTGSVDPSSNPWHGIIGGDSPVLSGHMWDDAIGGASVAPTGHEWVDGPGTGSVDPSGNPWHDAPPNGDTVVGANGVTYSCAGEVCVGIVPDGEFVPNASGCNHLVCVEAFRTGGSSYQVTGRGSGFFGHVDVWGPGLPRTSAFEEQDPVVFARGVGFGSVCAEGWARQSNGSHVSVGLPCVSP